MRRYSFPLPPEEFESKNRPLIGRGKVSGFEEEFNKSAGLLTEAPWDKLGRFEVEEDDGEKVLKKKAGLKKRADKVYGLDNKREGVSRDFLLPPEEIIEECVHNPDFNCDENSFEHYSLNEVVGFLRKYAEDPDIIYFIADMLEE